MDRCLTSTIAWCGGSAPRFRFTACAVRDIANSNFGLLIAYVIPGFVALWGLSYQSPVVAAWLLPGPTIPAGIESLFFVTVASIAAGMTASAFRWAAIDTLHHVTGLPRPEWDDERLADRVQAFDTIVEAHYRYYQCYANTCVALAFAYPAWTSATGGATLSTHIAFVIVELVFLAMSRDALRKYYARAARLLGILDRAEGRLVMGNGNHPPKPSPQPQKPAPETKKPSSASK